MEALRQEMEVKFEPDGDAQRRDSALVEIPDSEAGDVVPPSTKFRQGRLGGLAVDGSSHHSTR